MTSSTGKLAPYAPLATVVGLIRRRRERGLPEVLNAEKLPQLSVPESTVSRTLQALRFLNLVDEEGRQTPVFSRLALTKENEYPGILAEIIRAAYHDIFAIIGNPNDTNDIEINDAFRAYQPESQRNRMIILFRGLCQEAGLLAGGPPETRTRVNTASANKSSSSHANGAKNGTKKSVPKVEPAYQQEAHQPAISFTPPFDTNYPLATNSDSVLLRGVLNQLPLDTRKWTQAHRDKWLNAITANVDLLIDVVDSEDDLLFSE